MDGWLVGGCLYPLPAPLHTPKCYHVLGQHFFISDGLKFDFEKVNLNSCSALCIFMYITQFICTFNLSSISFQRGFACKRAYVRESAPKVLKQYFILVLYGRNVS